MKKSKKKNYKKSNKVTRKKSKLRGGGGKKNKKPSTKPAATTDEPKKSKKQQRLEANKKLNAPLVDIQDQITPGAVLSGALKNKIEELKSTQIGSQIHQMLSSHSKYKTIDTMFPAIHNASANEAGLKYPFENFSSQELFDLIFSFLSFF